MVSKKDDVIQKILFHTEGNGAFCKLKDKIFDESAWSELIEAINLLSMFWEGKKHVECKITRVLFDFLWKVEKEISKSDDSLKKKVDKVLSKIDISRLFWGDHGECPERIYTPPTHEEEEWIMTEFEAEQCVLFHILGGGAFRQARTYRKYDEPMWMQLVNAIKYLKKYMHGRQLIKREVAAAFVNLPLYIQYQIDYFQENNTNGAEVEQLSDVNKNLEVEIALLLNCS